MGGCGARDREEREQEQRQQQQRVRQRQSVYSVVLWTRASVPKMKVSSQSGVKPKPGKSQIPEPPADETSVRAQRPCSLTGPSVPLQRTTVANAAACGHAKLPPCSPRGKRGRFMLCVWLRHLHVLDPQWGVPVASAGQCRYAALLSLLLRLNYTTTTRYNNTAAHPYLALPIPPVKTCPLHRAQVPHTACSLWTHGRLGDTTFFFLFLSLEHPVPLPKWMPDIIMCCTALEHCPKRLKDRRWGITVSHLTLELTRLALH